MRIQPWWILTLLGASLPAFSGGGGVTREDLWESFQTPFAGYQVEDPISEATIGRLLKPLSFDGRNFQDTAHSQWARDVSLVQALHEELTSSRRKLTVHASAFVDQKGCVRGLDAYKVPHSLFSEGLESGHEDVVSQQIWLADSGLPSGFQVSRSMFLDWLERSNDDAIDRELLNWQRAAHIAWTTIIKSYYWTCDQVDPSSEKAELSKESRMDSHLPSQEEYRKALTLIEGTKAHEFLENYRRYLKQPTIDTAKYLVADDTRKLVEQHTDPGQLPNYERLANSAKNFLKLDPSSRIEYSGGFPADSPSWSHCSNEGAIRGIFEFAKELIHDQHLSDYAVRNTLYYRLNSAAECLGEPQKPLTEAELNSIPNEWRSYLEALDHFYQLEYEKAALAFEKLTDSDLNYVSRWSSYLAGRSFQVAAQQDWNGYNDPGEHTDQALLRKSSESFNAHIEQGGPYAASASGLLRRNAYLAGDQKSYASKLRQELATLLDGDIANRRASEVILLLHESNRHGLGLELVKYLNERHPPIAEETKLSALKPLLSFYNAAKLFHSGDLKAAYSAFMNGKLEPAYPYLIQIANRLNDPQKLEEIYKAFLEGNTLDIHLAALNYPEQGSAAFIDTDNTALAEHSAFAHCSVEKLRQTFLNNLQADNISGLRNALYDAYIQQEQFQTLHEMMSAKNVDHGDYEAIRTSIKQIATGKSLGKAYMNIGYFVDSKMAPPYGGGAPQFLSTLDPNLYCDHTLKNITHNAMYFYNKSLAQFGPDDHSVDEAKALHFMISCDRRGRHGCWGYRPQDAEPSEVLFKRLHRKYKNGKWAKKTPYYH